MQGTKRAPMLTFFAHVRDLMSALGEVRESLLACLMGRELMPRGGSLRITMRPAEPGSQAAADGWRKVTVHAFDAPPPRTGDAWEELDAPGHYFGVFAADDYTPGPIAIFSNVEDAHDWVRFMREHPDEDRRWSGGDIAFMVVRDLAGHAWNNLDSAPGACTHEVESDRVGRLECGEVAIDSSGAGEPRCQRHALPGADS
jgi:hypothetical protein